ncbi:MAG: lipocalin family protein [Bacteroidales bacterium]|nr:lipocalin family protein [Bacteroidales bacterium]
MKSIVNSQLTGKWYQIAKTYNRYEMKFVEVLLYFSMNCRDNLDLLYVGIKKDRSKILKKITSYIIEKDNDTYIVFKGVFFVKKLKMLLYDEDSGIMILSDDKKDYLTIYSRKSSFNPIVIEKYLSTIDFYNFNNNEVKLYVVE